MKKIGVISSDKEFQVYENLYNKELAISCIQMKSNEDFNNVEQIIIPHQELIPLDLLIERLQLKKSLDNWVENRLPLCCFGLATYYVTQGSKTKVAFPIKISMNRQDKKSWQLEEVMFYPSIDKFYCFVHPSLIVEVNSEDLEVLSKCKKNIIGFCFEKSIGCTFIPDKKLERNIIKQFIL